MADGSGWEAFWAALPREAEARAPLARFARRLATGRPAGGAGQVFIVTGSDRLQSLLHYGLSAALGSQVCWLPNDMLFRPETQHPVTWGALRGLRLAVATAPAHLPVTDAWVVPATAPGPVRWRPLRGDYEAFQPTHDWLVLSPGGLAIDASLSVFDRVHLLRLAVAEPEGLGPPFDADEVRRWLEAQATLPAEAA